MIDFMKNTRSIFRKDRKKFFFKYNDYNKMIEPEWMIRLNDKRFESTYSDQNILFKKGNIAIATIVQANYNLFEADDDTIAPAAIVYSEDEYFEKEPEKLKQIAHSLFQIKGEQVDDEEMQRFSDILEDQIVALFNVQIPKSISFNKIVYYTSIMVQRNHLPNGYLDFDFFPVLVLPNKTEASIILPSIYWDGEQDKREKTYMIIIRKMVKSYRKLEKFLDKLDSKVQK